MDILLIFETFRNLTGLSRDEAVKWYSLCDAAAGSVSARLRPEENCEKNRVPLSTAAAAEAFMNYVLVCAATEGDKSFSAGDVTVKETTAERVLAAKQLKESAFEDIQNLFCDTEFCFEQTEG